MIWREVAWNGVRLSTPITWEIAKIGPRYFLFLEEGQPVLEIKWNRIKGTFSHAAALRRLRATHGGRVRESGLPKDWKQALGDFVATGFAWQTETGGGSGAILYCPTCGYATLIQFFRHPYHPTNETALGVLSSFRDHSLDDDVIWSIFDIRAVIPAELQLAGSRFEAGLFEMKFTSKGQQVTLNRWGPAAVLLGTSDLPHFAGRTSGILETELQILRWKDRKAVQWEQAVTPGSWTIWWNSVRGMPSFRWFRLWHLEEKNRILSVDAKGKKPFDHGLLEKICTDYESL